MTAFKNGAKYYMEYFSKKYILNLQALDNLEKEINDKEANQNQENEENGSNSNSTESANDN